MPSSIFIKNYAFSTFFFLGSIAEIITATTANRPPNKRLNEKLSMPIATETIPVITAEQGDTTPITVASICCIHLVLKIQQKVLVKSVPAISQSKNNGLKLKTKTLLMFPPNTGRHKIKEDAMLSME